MNKAELLAGQIDALAALRAEKARVRARIHASGQRLGQMGQQMISPTSAEGKLVSVGHILSSGMAVYQGLRMGARVMGYIGKMWRRRR